MKAGRYRFADFSLDPQDRQLYRGDTPLEINARYLDAPALPVVLSLIFLPVLLCGSLDLLARSFPASRLRLDPVGGLFGEAEFGIFNQIMTGGLEGALFAGCMLAALVLAGRWSRRGNCRSLAGEAPG